jgi:protoporphyrinogen/coproporphyrinogen III oxidase
MTVAVIGGGLAGALNARALQLAGEQVLVLDANREPGGIAFPVARDGFSLEPAAGTVMLPHPHLSPLLEGLGLGLIPATAAGLRRLVHHRGTTTEVAPGPRLLASPLLSARAKLRLLAEPFVRRGAPEDESLETFLVRRLGGEAGRLAAWLMAAGVHAGDPGRLSARAVTPMLIAAEQGHGSMLRGGLAARRRTGDATRPSTHMVEGGTASIAGAVAAELGEAWMGSWPVERIERAGEGWRLHGPDSLQADRVVAAVPPAILDRLLPDELELGADDPWAPVAVVWLGTTRPLPEAIGALVGPDEGFASLGFLFESSYAPFRAPAGKGLVKAIVGGATSPAVVELDDEALIGRVRSELERVLGESPEVEMSHVVRHRPGIPQFTGERLRMVQRLGVSLPAGLTVAGWAYDGVGVSHLATAASSRAESLSRGSGNS